jgi:2,3-bisphosphoglycerate-independent phosphoglycerate mutase
MVSKLNGGTCHVMGLLSPGGVHSHQRHFEYVVRVLREMGVSVTVHGFLDGRDTPPQSALGYVQTFMDNVPGVQFGSISGRYYAMDRDTRWDRVQLAYDAIVSAEGNGAIDALSAIEASYTSGVTDEFVLPTVIGEYKGMKDGDAVLMINFRADRAREILTAFVDPDFTGFQRKNIVQFSSVVGMVSYSEDLDPFMPALFAPEELTNTLGQVVADAGLNQLRIAETEKYAHVTFFFNGGEEKQFVNEDRILVPSPKVATYDMLPQMSAVEVTDRLIEAVESGKYDLIVVNYANTDMVGHTGDEQAAILSVEAVDDCMDRLSKAVLIQGGALLITADHGNVEVMIDEVTGQPHTAHTLNPVPFIVVADNYKGAAVADGLLSDVAPTILHMLGMHAPKEMTGKNLIAKL